MASFVAERAGNDETGTTEALGESEITGMYHRLRDLVDPLLMKQQRAGFPTLPPCRFGPH